jgi:hypothetical protein
MRQRLRSHLTFANVASLIALFIALGGSATAAVIITSNSQVASGTISGHHPPAGKHPNIIPNSVNGQDVQNLQFQALVLKNGWQGNCFGGGVPAIAKSAERVVYFRGEMCRGSGTSINAFKVPSGFAPTKTEWITVDTIDATTGRLQINPSGDAFVENDHDHPNAGFGFTSLAGANYTLPF